MGSQRKEPTPREVTILRMIARFFGTRYGHKHHTEFMTSIGLGNLVGAYKPESILNALVHFFGDDSAFGNFISMVIGNHRFSHEEILELELYLNMLGYTRKEGKIILLSQPEKFQIYHHKIEQGSIFSEPARPWSLGLKLETLLKETKSSLKISSPYINDTTFKLLEDIMPAVNIELMITEDQQFKSKVEKRYLTHSVVERFTKKQNIQIRKLEDLHLRMAIRDGEMLLILSSDLQTESLSKKYGYAIWTDDEDIIATADSYFDKLWNDGFEIDLAENIADMSIK